MPPESSIKTIFDERNDNNSKGLLLLNSVWVYPFHGSKHLGSKCFYIRIFRRDIEVDRIELSVPDFTFLSVQMANQYRIATNMAFEILDCLQTSIAAGDLLEDYLIRSGFLKFA
jgi:hypothetical protein